MTFKRQLFQALINDAFQAQQDGQSASQWVLTQVKKADSQVRKDVARAAAKIVWA